MARSFGRVLASIWDDDDFKALSRSAQCKYLFLLSQSDLEHSGVIPLRERRWAGSCDEMTPAQVVDDIKELAAARFVEVDEDTEELLVRSLIRRDEVWKQPNVFKSAAASVMAVKSKRIKAVLLDELRRLDLSDMSAEVRRVLNELLDHLEPFGNPSGTLREGSAMGSEGAQGKGEGNASSTGVPLTQSPKPQPRAPRAPTGARATRLGTTLLDEHLEACQQRPPRDVIRRTGEKIDDLLDEPDITPDMIRSGLMLMRSRPRAGPGLLPDLVHEARSSPSENPQRPGRRSGRNVHHEHGAGDGIAQGFQQ